ncbi:MAG: aspartate/glutamate racemase family protein [Ignavibacteria bacterium]|nr:aspartate/glutamate racemase family protein [Ignavibacteria bacterium]
MSTKKIIGVVGGVGPQAGLDLVQKILDQTIATSDQEHLPLILTSYPDQIADRTAFITGKSSTNPAYAIASILQQLETAGATVAGIACNAAHAPKIFDVIRDEMSRWKSKLHLLHMIEEIARSLKEVHPAVRSVGLISTLGTAKSKVYQTILEPKGYAVIAPSEEVQRDLIHRAIYDPEYGIKSRSHPVTERARTALLKAIGMLIQNGAEAVILGCTEVPLAIPESHVEGFPALDSTLILARALIREANPSKLRPLTTP